MIDLIFANEGETAVQIFLESNKEKCEKNIHLIIMDYQMNKMNGV